MDKVIINLLDKIISKRELKLSKKYNIIGKKKVNSYKIELYRNLLNCIDEYNSKRYRKFVLRHYRYFEVKSEDIEMPDFLNKATN